MKTKKCIRCGSRRKIKFFNKDSQQKSGYRLYCVFCLHGKRPSKYRKRYNQKELPPGVRYCTDCKQIKPLELFPPDNSGFRGCSSHCLACCAVRVRKRKIKIGPEGRWKDSRRAVLRRRGLTEDSFALMWKRQDGKCMICGELFGRQFDACVDHDHKIGKIRGLLCRGCNLILGHARDDTKILSAAIAYLEKSLQLQTANLSAVATHH